MVASSEVLNPRSLAMPSFFPVDPIDSGNVRMAKGPTPQKRGHPWRPLDSIKSKARTKRKKRRVNSPSDRTVSKERAAYLASIFNRARDEDDE